MEEDSFTLHQGRDAGTQNIKHGLDEKKQSGNWTNIHSQYN